MAVPSRHAVLRTDSTYDKLEQDRAPESSQQDSVTCILKMVAYAISVSPTDSLRDLKYTYASVITYISGFTDM